jgi:hypothetical protein
LAGEKASVRVGGLVTGAFCTVSVAVRLTAVVPL